MVAPKTDTCSFPTSLPQSLTAMNKVCDTAVDHRSGLGKDWLAVRTGDMDVVCDKARRSEGGRPVGRSARLKRRRGDEMASPRSWAPKPSTPTMANRLGDAWGWARRGEPQLNRALARFHGSVPGELTSDGMTWGAWTWQEVKLASRAAFPGPLCGTRCMVGPSEENARQQSHFQVRESCRLSYSGLSECRCVGIGNR